MQTSTVLGIFVELMGAPIRGADRFLPAGIATRRPMSFAECESASPPAKNAIASTKV